MGKYTDLLGQKFGLLTVISFSYKTLYSHFYWDCVCECGGTALVNGYTLVHGKKQSCGCAAITPQERFWAKVDKTETCWLWNGALSSFGHGKLTIGNTQYRAHRVSWEWQYGPIPDDLCVLHICDVPNCVNPKHLFLGTKQDNTDDMFAKGRHRRKDRFGEDINTARLTEKIVANIILAHRSDSSLSARHFSSIYGVCPATINMIFKGRTWKHLACLSTSELHSMFKA